MKVLHVVEASEAGVARHLIDLCTGLVQHGVEVHLVYSPVRMDALMQRGLERLQQLGVRPYALPMRRAPHWSDLRAMARLHAYIQQQGPFDVIHAHSSKAGGITRLLALLSRSVRQTPLVYTPHAFVTLAQWMGWKRRVYGAVERLLAPFTTRLIAVSEVEREEALRLGYPPAKLVKIYHGIHPLNPPAGCRSVRRRWGVPDSGLVIGFLGRLDHQKNPFLLLRAFAKALEALPHSTTLVLAGSGPLAEPLQRTLHSWGLQDRVFLPGFMKAEEALCGFDLFVISSDYEVGPYVLLEAMAVGLPVVTTRVGMAPEILQDGVNGFVVPCNDEETLADRMVRLATDPNLRRHMGKRAKETVRQFSVDRMVAQTLQLYEQIQSPSG